MLAPPQPASLQHAPLTTVRPMTDGEAASTKPSRAAVDALLRKQDWGRIHAELVEFALRRVKGKDRADDLAQEAIRRVLDANWEPWDPVAKPSLLEFLMGIVNRIVSNERSGHRVHRELAMDRTAEQGTRARRVAAQAEKVVSGEASPETRVIAAQLASRRMERLRGEIAEDVPLQKLVAQREDNVTKASEQATAMSCSVEEVYFANRRLNRIVARVCGDVPAESVNRTPRSTPPRAADEGEEEST